MAVRLIRQPLAAEVPGPLTKALGESNAYCTEKKASNALRLGWRSLALLVGLMLIQLSHTEQLLEVSDGILLAIRITVRIRQ